MILGKKTQVLDFLTWKTCTASTLPLPLRSKCVIAAVWEPRWAALPNNMQPHLHRPNSACVLGRVLDTSTPTAASTLTAMCTERASRGVTTKPSAQFIQSSHAGGETDPEPESKSTAGGRKDTAQCPVRTRDGTTEPGHAKSTLVSWKDVGVH